MINAFWRIILNKGKWAEHDPYWTMKFLFIFTLESTPPHFQILEGIQEDLYTF